MSAPRTPLLSCWTPAVSCRSGLLVSFNFSAEISPTIEHLSSVVCGTSIRMGRCQAAGPFMDVERNLPSADVAFTFDWVTLCRLRRDTLPSTAGGW